MRSRQIINLRLIPRMVLVKHAGELVEGALVSVLLRWVGNELFTINTNGKMKPH